MNRIAVLLLLSAGLTGCLTSRDPQVAAPVAVVAETPAAILADSTAERLAYMARHDPDRLETALPQLLELVAALNDRPPLPDGVVPRVMSEAEPLPADWAEAQSLRHGVHLASYRHEENLRSGWAELQAEYPALQAREARFEETTLEDRGVFLRLKAGPFDSHADAMAFCADLTVQGAYCMPVDFSGNPLTDSGPGAHE